MPGSVQPDEQLEWERRAGRLAGVAAIAGAVLLVAGSVLGARATEPHAYQTYLRVDGDPSLIILPSIVQALGYVAIAVTLFYLARATAARRTEMAAPTRVMALVGPIATAVAAVLLAFAIVKVAHEFADLHKTGTDKVRDDALSDVQTGSDFYRIASYVTVAARLALGFAFVLGALNAMRAGLLSRFLGILGVIAGVLSVLFGGASIIMSFWLGAVGLIFLNRWPGDRGPAWDTVEAIPWPTAMDRQRAEMEARGESPDDDDEPDEDEPDDEDLEDEDEDGVEPDLEPEPEPKGGASNGAARTHPAANKRKKRKRR
jgi:hypothetical protein